MTRHRRLTPGAPGYPDGLADLEDQPTLYLAGEMPNAPAVAIVGTRRCTRYGVDLAEACGAAVARSGWVTVSGLARGIDAAAHRGSLRASGGAVAVLGSGIDVCYPRENRPIFDQIIADGGAILSEYPPGTPPDRWRFPARNRIIAALSRVVVVVEAARTGGALITARLAAEIGRPVFAMPGDVDRPASEGCNLLIRDGAFPVLGDADLIEELSLILGPPPTQRDDADGSENLPPDAGATLDELAGLWAMSISDVMSRVGRMELEGKVRRDGDLILPT